MKRSFTMFRMAANAAVSHMERACIVEEKGVVYATYTLSPCGTSSVANVATFYNSAASFYLELNNLKVINTVL
jgi:hypothetical protein